MVSPFCSLTISSFFCSLRQMSSTSFFFFSSEIHLCTDSLDAIQKWKLWVNLTENFRANIVTFLISASKFLASLNHNLCLHSENITVFVLFCVLRGGGWGLVYFPKVQFVKSPPKEIWEVCTVNRVFFFVLRIRTFHCLLNINLNSCKYVAWIGI